MLLAATCAILTSSENHASAYPAENRPRFLHPALGQRLGQLAQTQNFQYVGGDEARQATYQGLRSAEGYIRSQLARSINLRNTPTITFVMDQSIEYGVNMSKRIDEVISADEEAGAGGNAGGNT